MSGERLCHLNEKKTPHQTKTQSKVEKMFAHICRLCVDVASPARELPVEWHLIPDSRTGS